MKPLRAVALLAILLAALAGTAIGIVLHERSELTADWHRLIDRAATGGLRLTGVPHFKPALSGTVLTVRDIRLSSPAPDAPSLRTAAIAIEHRPSAPGSTDVEFSAPVIVSCGGLRWQLEGRAIVLRGARSGPIRLVADELVLPVADVPAADRTLASLSVDFIPSGAEGAPVLLVRSAHADWLGMTVVIDGRLTATGGRLDGALMATLGTGWRDAVGRAARDGAITRAEARAAEGLLGLLGSGKTAPALPLAIDDGRVTLAGLLLTRLPDFAPPAPQPAAPR